MCTLQHNSTAIKHVVERKFIDISNVNKFPNVIIFGGQCHFGRTGKVISEPGKGNVCEHDIIVKYMRLRKSAFTRTLSTDGCFTLPREHQCGIFWWRV